MDGLLPRIDLEKEILQRPGGPPLRNREAHVCAAEPYLDILLAASCAVGKAADETEQVLVPVQVKCQARVQDPDLVQRAQRIPVGEELRKAVGHANGMNGENCVVGSFGPVDREVADLDVLEDRGGNCRVADAPAQHLFQRGDGPPLQLCHPLGEEAVQLPGGQCRQHNERNGHQGHGSVCESFLQSSLSRRKWNLTVPTSSFLPSTREKR